ncbi:Mn-containing catalase [Catenuloplanes nepalensis]|uniref:Mn-containing catalase n=1 Tax=Catenuloplanes nepalensis TaxID=587533 RepID=A0ABT9MPX1_9ACTN|nr:manganese catalase family protein [Catenuloplanes nepalensis]MDP9793353.1 Mn-containing catalase [Catenuloplanes nepalensis]
MFSHVKDLQFEAKPDGPDALFARRLQEVLGGKWGELTVANQYLFQGWTCRLPGKYKDLLLDVGTEEMGHVEMICTMIARLLEGAPQNLHEAAADDNPMLAAIYSGQNPAQFIHAGGGPLPVDSNGVPWNGSYITASGNLMADFQLNVTAEAQGRLQVARLYHMTDDPGVKQMLRFLLARDHMHQNMWMAAIEQLKADGLEDMPVPEAYPDAEQENEFAYRMLNFSAGEESAEGRWASGATPDGKGTFSYDPKPQAHAAEPVLPPGDPRLYGTPPPTGGGIIGAVKDALT